MKIEYGRIPEWPKGADCKSVVIDFGGSNPPSPTKYQNRLKHCVQGGFLFAFRLKLYALKICFLTVFYLFSLLPMKNKAEYFQFFKFTIDIQKREWYNTNCCKAIWYGE